MGLLAEYRVFLELLKSEDNGNVIQKHIPRLDLGLWFYYILLVRKHVTPF